MSRCKSFGRSCRVETTEGQRRGTSSHQQTGTSMVGLQTIGHCSESLSCLGQILYALSQHGHDDNRCHHRSLRSAPLRPLHRHRTQECRSAGLGVSSLSGKSWAQGPGDVGGLLEAAWKHRAGEGSDNCYIMHVCSPTSPGALPSRSRCLPECVLAT